MKNPVVHQDVAVKMKHVILICLLYYPVTISSAKMQEEQHSSVYPELMAFIQSLKNRDFNKEHIGTLDYIKSSIAASHLVEDNWNLVFYCNENSLRSQVAQVFAQIFCFIGRHRRIKVYSAGLVTGTIDTKLIEYLGKIGYRISKGVRNNQVYYEIKFSDEAEPAILFSKTIADKSLPTETLIPVVVCDPVKETECAPLKNKSAYDALAFPKMDTATEDIRREAVIKEIATELLYVSK